MTFRVAARTILELGSELISSDAIAVYELVKNAIDAKSKDGITIRLNITLRQSDYVELLEQISHTNHDDLKTLQDTILKKTLPSSSSHSLKKFHNFIKSASSIQELKSALAQAYVDTNSIQFEDTGVGMSHIDLREAYLLIGTPSRKRAIDAALEVQSKRASTQETPFLGEKGIGRLSVMRLGNRLHIQTATTTDKKFNILEVDWRRFEDLDALLEDIAIEPKEGNNKEAKDYSGTVLTISDLVSNWSPSRIRDIAIHEFARLSDPFSKKKRRFRIAIFFNGERIDVPRLDKDILELAHAQVSGEYRVHDGRAQLEFQMECQDLGFGNPAESKRAFLDTIDLKSITHEPNLEDIPSSALSSLGPFSFEVYWYNRLLLKGIDSIGNRKRVAELQKRWSGIMLFRDGYRVFPYGSDEDDWLSLDRKALAAQGYKLNKQQFIGRVAITRLNNPQLIDQTNREGLKECPEKMAFLEVLRYVIQERLGKFLNEVKERYQGTKIDLSHTESQIQTAERKAFSTLRQLRERHPTEAAPLRELQATFEEMRIYFTQAKQQAEQAEDEQQRMIQLAGVGLMLEVVAHELARSTEHTLQILNQAQTQNLSGEVSALFNALRDQMKTMNKRLRILDPLSVSGRQRKEKFDLVVLTRDIFDGRKAQFDRHKIRTKISVEAGSNSRIMIHGVKGMFVQIIENLLSNSVYWLKLRKSDEKDFQPQITVTLSSPPVILEFWDNGPGIQPDLQEEVFKAFFSTKGRTKRQGLGLFIARDCAQYNGGSLYLDNERTEHKDRLNTFILELPENIIGQQKCLNK